MEAWKTSTKKNQIFWKYQHANIPAVGPAVTAVGSELHENDGDFSGAVMEVEDFKVYYTEAGPLMETPTMSKTLILFFTKSCFILFSHILH